ncbi:MAG: NAD(P)H-binding protein [Gammaproteobacteria bacterium]
MDEPGRAPAIKPTRILLTGATGFIGRHVQHVLLDAGCAVTALVRAQSPRRNVLLPGVEVLTGALDDVPLLLDALPQVDLVVYVAGSVRGREANDFRAANIDGIAALVEAAAGTGGTRVVLVSSLAASRPALSAYAASKRAGEALLQRSGLEWVVLRPPAVYGPGDTEMRPLLASLRRGFVPLLGPRGQRLSLLHARDLAHAIVAVVMHFEACAGRVFDLDDGRPGGYSWPELIAAVRGARRYLALRVPRGLLALVARINEYLSRQLGYQPMLTPGKVHELCEPYWLCNNLALTAATNWSPQIQLHDGVRDTFSRT